MSLRPYLNLSLRFARERTLSRRAVLRISLASAAGAMLGCVSERRRSPRSASGPRVIVIGAGLAGLACSDALVRAGCSVRVLEARAIVGGRVRSLRSPGSEPVLEAGGEFIGANHPRWLALAERFGLELAEVPEEPGESPLLVTDGRAATGVRSASQAEAELVWEHIEAGGSVLTDKARNIDALEPWTSADAAAIDGTSVAGFLDEQAMPGLARSVADALLSADAGVACERQSMLAQLAMIRGGGLEAFWTESEVYRCAQGNDQLARALAEAIGGERLSLGEPVASIDVLGERVVVVTASGREHEADHVVLAVPPTTWDRIAVGEGLAAQAPGALRGDRPALGPVVKHLSTLDRPVWLADDAAPDIVHDGTPVLTWQSGNTRANGGSHRVLAAFAGGPSAQAMRAMTDQQRNDRIDRLLATAYPSGEARVLDRRFLDWPSEPWTGAGYSFPDVGQVTTVCAALRTPIAGRIHHAGEHCSTAFVGYMEGALESGLRAADRVLGR